MLRRWIGTIAALVLGCSSNSGGIGLGDSTIDFSWDGGAPMGAVTLAPPALPAPPVPPATAANPVLTPCPEGWSESSTEVTVCEPWPDATRPTCEAGMFAVPGGSCQALGAPCPGGDWPADLPAGAPVVYVRPDAPPGGDGSALAPLALLSTALSMAEAEPGTVVALGGGTFPASLPIPPSTTLVGTCVTGTVLTDDPALPAATAILSVEAPGVHIQNLQITGSQVGLSVSGPDATAVLDGVWVNATTTYGVTIDAGATAQGSAMLIEGTLTDAEGALGIGLQALGGSHVELTRAAFLRNHQAATFIHGANTTADLSDVAIAETLGLPSDRVGGHSLVVTDDATVLATRLVGEANNASTFLVQSGATVTLEDVVARDSRRHPAAAEGSGRGLQVWDGAVAEGTRVLLDNNEEVGVLVSGAGATLTLSDSVVRHTVSLLGQLGRGVHVQSGGQLEGTRLFVEHNREVGLYVSDPGSTATLTDYVARDQIGRELDGLGGMALVIHGSAHLDVTRAHLVENTAAGIFAGGEGVEVSITDLTVERTREGIMEDDGRGIFVQAGATAHIRRALFEENLAGAIVVSLEGAMVDAEDVTIRDTRPTTEGIGGHGVVTMAGARLSLRRALVERSHQLAVAARDPGTFMLLEDLTTRDTQLSGNDVFPIARGLNLQEGARAEVHRMLVERSGDVAIAILEPRSEEVLSNAALEDITVRALRGSHQDAYGRGIHVQGGTAVAVERALLEDNRGIGISAMAGASLTLADVAVRNTQPLGCPTCPAREGIGVGAYGGAHIVATGLESANNGAVGLQVAFGTEVSTDNEYTMSTVPGGLDIEGGHIVRNPIGANLGVEGYDVDRVMSDVVYEANGRNLDAVALPAPEALGGGF